MALFGKKKTDASQDIPPETGMPPGYPDQGYGDYGQDYGQYPQGYAPEQYQAVAPQAPQMPSPPAPEESHEKMEEIAEAIVEEKWNEKKRDIDKVMEWKEDVNTKLAQLQQQIDDLKVSFDSLHKGILGKITEYDENLTNVGTEIKAMEKVFSKILPSLTESINKLDRFATKAPAVDVLKKK